MIHLFSAVVFGALAKCCELYHIGIEESFEKEMVEGMKNMFYPISLNTDRRTKWDIPIAMNPDKDRLKFNFSRLYLPNRFRYYKRCKICKITYPIKYKISTCKRCGNRIYQEKDKPSRSYFKNIKIKIKELENKMYQYLTRLLNMMKIIKDDYFSIKIIKDDFPQILDKASNDLQILKMGGKTRYGIVHYDQYATNKKECYISKESDFMNISIKLKEYNHLLREMVKSQIYGIGKIKTKNHSKIINLLRQLNFPEIHILIKIQKDFDKCREIYQYRQKAN